jgi:hypothetical protein
MNTSILNRDLTKEAPHSPQERFGGYAILGRTVDKCRAQLAGKLGDYHFDCPLDNQLFSFKGIDGAQFKTAVSAAKTYEDVSAWLQTRGTPKSPEEIRAWSDKMDALKAKDIPTMRDPEHRKHLDESCEKLGLDVETVTLFDWLDADDVASFQEQPELARK